MSGLRGRSAVAADHRSALPRVPGIPWWAAAILAASLTAIGVAYDVLSGDKALSAVFVVFYVLGCVAAVLAVRQSGVFTAVIQPPLILFCAVPGAYFLFHGAKFTGIKDLVINYGYPLIERFPLMFFTSATVLVIGMVRWYMGAAARRAVPQDAEPIVDAPEEVAATSTPASTTPKTKARRTRSVPEAGAAAASAAMAADALDDEPPRRRRTPRPAAAGSPRSSGAAAGTGFRRSRHSRPPETELIEPVQDRPRRRNTPPIDAPAEPRRRPRAGDPREREPREPRDPRERRPIPPQDRRSAQERSERERYERPERPQRRERPEAYERAERPERQERPQRRPRSADYEPYEPPPRSTNGNNGTHHPVSRVRYRGADEGESRTEHRTRPRRPRHSAPDSWEYDV